MIRSPKSLLFLIQLYIRQKKESACWNENCPFPRDVDFMIADTIESMRPKLQLYSSVEEAQEAANELTKEYEEKISKFSRIGCYRRIGFGRPFFFSC